MPQTRPIYYNAYGNGLGVVPRRGWDTATAGFLATCAAGPVQGVSGWAEGAPMRLLSVLHRHHPLFALARFNDLTLAFAPGDTTIVAEDDAGKVSDTGTQALNALWDRLPDEINGLAGLQENLYDYMAWGGQMPIEVVPGKRGEGVSQILPFDPLTTRYQDKGGGRVLQQMQGGAPVDLDPRFVRAFALGATRDDPYGVPLRAQAMADGLRDLTNQRRTDDVLHAIAWPRLSVGFPFEELVQFATDRPELLQGQGPADPDSGLPGDLTPVQWAFQMFEELSAALITQKHDDTFIRPKGTEATVLSGAGGLAALEGTLKTNRFRLYAALLQLPGLMGETDGGTQAFTTVQYDKQRKSCEWLRHFVNRAVCWVGDRHLQLLGMPLKARADTEPMASLDALRDQQARALEIDSDLTLFDRGLLSGDDIAQRLTGSGVVDETKLESGATTQPAAQPANQPPDPKALPDPSQSAGRESGGG